MLSGLLLASSSSESESTLITVGADMGGVWCVNCIIISITFQGEFDFRASLWC